MTVLESTLSVENRYRQLFRQRLVILAVIFIAIIASLLLDFTLGPSGLPLHSLIKTLMHPSGATNGMRVIVWDIRLPYALPYPWCVKPAGTADNVITIIMGSGTARTAIPGTSVRRGWQNERYKNGAGDHAG